MIHDELICTLPDGTPGSPENLPLQVPSIVREVKHLWRQGVPPDARAFLDQHPELAVDRSVVLDLALEEFGLRLENNSPLDPDEFCQRFPELQASLRSLLRVFSFMGADPELAPDPREVDRLAPGDFLRGFALHQELGRGAFARVFLASEPALGGRRVALKVGCRGSAEAKILGPLRHPNIVPIHSVRTDLPSGLTLVCMPYLGRATLVNVLDRAFARRECPARAQVILQACNSACPGAEPDVDAEPVAPALAEGSYVEGVLHLAVQMADALAFLHRRGVCHRDLKPSNVLLTPYGRPMLMDFNLAVDAGTAPVHFGGTVPYMAPEQLQALSTLDENGPFAPADARSDLYSFGVILYELLSGRSPFGELSGDSSLKAFAGRLLEAQRNGPRSLRQANPRVGKAVAQLVERCLAFTPAARPSSAADLATALRNELSRLERRRRWFTRRTLVLSTATVLLAAVGVASAVLLPGRNSQDWLDRGWESYREGRFEESVKHFQRAVEADRESAAAWYARGRAYQQLGQDGLARDNYREADRLAPDGRARACIGYCLSRTLQHMAAIREYDAAIEMEYGPAEVFNNRGYSYLQVNLLAQAKKDLNDAIKLNPRLQAAYYNRALIDLQKALHTPGYTPQDGINDLETALQLGPIVAEHHRHAAALHAMAARQDCSKREHALKHLQKAVDQGQDPAAFADDSALAVLLDDPRFQTLIKQPPSSLPQEPPVRLLDPAPDPPR